MWLKPNGFVGINTPTPATYADGSPNTALQNSQRLQRRWFTQNSNFNVDEDYFYLGDEVNVNGQQFRIRKRFERRL